ncbi:hypothetical protein [Streptomyces coelicoflavus]|uniref:Integral membrane protein n=1 Tax=Streptomyces coelicoflavus TaxID=285562 RepID=A0A6N9UXG9_9ACTN|nr:hypothetical protein [Streptomyces coelicoflavus]NEB21059.1 hypothetical protein [Streptomyces coelicoflavus]
MHGHGYAPPPPPRRPATAVLVLLRVFFVALALLSLGFLAWIPTLYAAVVTRRPRHWWAFAVSVVLLVVSFCFMATDDTDDFSTPAGTAGMIILLLNACACAGYFLYADITHHRRPPRPGHIPPMPLPVAPGYGHPQPGHPQPGHPQPGHPQPGHPQPGHPYAPAPAVAQTPAPPYQAPPPQHQPAPARIDQVRAELDELSDYLRHHDGGGHDGRGHDQGGR